MDDVRRASRLVEIRETAVMKEEDAAAKQFQKETLQRIAVKKTTDWRCAAEVKMKLAPLSLGAEQVLQAAKSAEIHAQLALSQTTRSLLSARIRCAVMSHRVGRARYNLMKVISKKKQEFRYVNAV